MPKTWRQYYGPQIAAHIKEHEAKGITELKKILSAANPGMYGHHKKIWANEYMRQLGLSKKKSKCKEQQHQLKIF